MAQNIFVFETIEQKYHNISALTSSQRPKRALTDDGVH